MSIWGNRQYDFGRQPCYAQFNCTAMGSYAFPVNCRLIEACFMRYSRITVLWDGKPSISFYIEGELVVGENTNNGGNGVKS